MGQGMRFHSISVQRIVLLIVLALQGIAPDARDLASLRGLYVLCQLPTPPDASADDTGEMADDVCGPMGRAMNSDLREQLEQSVRFEFISNTPVVSLSPACTFQSKAIQRLVLQSDDLTRSPCRLIC